MANLTGVLDKYLDTLLHPAVQALQEVLPAEFFVVEHAYFPDYNLPTKVTFIADTQEEAEQWIIAHVKTWIKREEGKFSIRGSGSREQVRFWIKIFETTGKKSESQPVSGILYRITKSSSSDLAIRLLR